MEVAVREKLQKLVDILSIICNSCVKTPISPVVPDLRDALLKLCCGWRHASVIILEDLLVESRDLEYRTFVYAHFPYSEEVGKIKNKSSLFIQENFVKLWCPTLQCCYALFPSDILAQQT